MVGEMERRIGLLMWMRLAECGSDRWRQVVIGGLDADCVLPLTVSWDG